MLKEIIDSIFKDATIGISCQALRELKTRRAHDCWLQVYTYALQVSSLDYLWEAVLKTRERSFEPPGRSASR